MTWCTYDSVLGCLDCVWVGFACKWILVANGNGAGQQVKIYSLHDYCKLSLVCGILILRFVYWVLICGIYIPERPVFVSPAKHSGTMGSLCPASVCPSVCLSGIHAFLVVTHSYVSKATHAFLGMLPLCLYLIYVSNTTNRHVRGILYLQLDICKNKTLANKRRFTVQCMSCHPYIAEKTLSVVLKPQ